MKVARHADGYVTGRPQKSVRFAAMIAHADDPEMLDICIRHHLAAGFEHIFVSLNRDDPRSAIVARTYSEIGRVRVARMSDYAGDGLKFFTEALPVIREWCAPEWLALIDSDEFWMVEGGNIHNMRGLVGCDVVEVRRFNAPVVSGAERHGVSPDSLVFAPEERSSHWLRGKVGPKVMVRPDKIQSITQGAHGAEGPGGIRSAKTTDAVILHLPFTTLDRFQRKVDAVRARLGLYGGRFKPSHARHWRAWAQLNDDGIVSEFKAQCLDAQEAERLVTSGELVKVSRLLSGVDDTAAAASVCGPSL